MKSLIIRNFVAGIMLASTILGAELPEKLPTTPAALGAYANLRAAYAGVSYSGRLVAEARDGDSYVEVNTEGNAKAFTAAIAQADPEFGVVDPSIKVWLSIGVYDVYGNSLRDYGDYRGVVPIKDGGYNLDDYGYDLQLSKIFVDVGQEVRMAEIVYVDENGYIDEVVPLDFDEGSNGYYVWEDELARTGGFIRLYVGDDWEEVFYSPDGDLLTPELTEVSSLNGTVQGVRIVNDQWEHLVIPTSRGRGVNIVTDFHPQTSGYQAISAELQEGGNQKMPEILIIVGPDGVPQKYPAIMRGIFARVYFEAGVTYQVYHEWYEGDLLEDGYDSGNNGGGGGPKGIAKP
jgi:hypothetical protein